MTAELCQIEFADWWEVEAPLFRANELLNDLWSDRHLSQNLVLSLFFGISQFLLVFGWQYLRAAISLQLSSQFFSCRADRHSCTMESKGEQYVEPLQGLKSSIEVTFGQRKSVTQMHCAIHIWIGESLEVLWSGDVNLSLEDILSSPDVLSS